MGNRELGFVLVGFFGGNRVSVWESGHVPELDHSDSHTAPFMCSMPLKSASRIG